MKVPYIKCGKCGDTVWQRNRYGQISYPYHKPFNPKSSGQRFVRASFGSVSARWRTLTEAQRVVWHAVGRTKKTRSRLGQRFPMNGFNYFVQVNVALANRGLPQVDLPLEKSAQSKPSAPLLSQILVRYDKGLVNQVPPELRPFLRPTAIWSAFRPPPK